MITRAQFNSCYSPSYYYGTCRYLVLDPAKIRRGDWDEGVLAGDACYSERMHNICCDNCHSHVAKCLNTMEYDGKTNWNTVTLAIWMFFGGKFISIDRTLCTFLPFFILAAFLCSLNYAGKSGI